MTPKDLQISIAPLPKREVEYFEEITIPLTIVSDCSEPTLIESVTLRFQTDTGMSDVYMKRDLAHQLSPHDLYSAEIAISPTPAFLSNTNEFHVLVRYRIVHNDVPGPQLPAKSPGSYLIVKHCAPNLGELFISFKQPEDRRLARILERVAERAGFRPYLAMNDSTPGMDLWHRIEPKLLASIAVAFIWTERTEWGDGVEREIELCKSHGIQNVLLIQQDLDPPQQFVDSGIEYQPFDPEDPLEQYSQAIIGLRRIVLSGSSRP